MRIGTAFFRIHLKDLIYFSLAEAFALRMILLDSKELVTDYKATGTNFLTGLHATYPQAQLDKVLHIFFALIVYQIFKRTINSFAAAFGVIIFGIESIHRLVFLSAPFWDFMNYLPVAIAIYLLIEFYSPDSKVHNSNRHGYVAIIQSINTWLLLFILFMEFYKKYEALFPNVLSKTTILTLGATVLLYVTKLFQVKIKSLLQRVERNEQLFLQLYLLNILLSATYGRYTTSLVPILLNVLLIVIFAFNRFKFGNLLTIFMSVTVINFIVLVNLNFFSASGAGFAFYFFAGMSNPVNISLLFQYRQFDPLVKFWDSDIKQYLALVQDKQVYTILQNPGPYLERIHSHLNDFFEYFTFSYGLGEPFPGLPSPVGQLWTYWSTNSITPMISKLSIFVIALLIIKKFGKKSTFLFLPVVMLFILVMITRPQLHQWWLWDMCGTWALFMVIKIFGHFLIHPKALFYTIKAIVQEKYLRAIALFLFLTLIFSLSLLPTFSIYKLAVNSSKMEPDSGWTPINKARNELNFQFIEKEDKYQIKVHEAIRLRVLPKRECSRFQFSVYKMGIDHSTGFQITSGQSMKGGEFVLPLNPGNFVFTYRSLAAKSCNLQFDFAKESDFESAPGALFLGKSGEQKAHSSSRKVISTANQISLPDSFNLVSRNFSNRIVNSKYVAYGLENLNEHLERNLSAKLLGFTGEGYMLRDLESLSYENSMGAKSLRVEGKLEFGNLGFLNSEVDSGDQHLTEPVDVEFIHLKPGAARKFDFCFPLTQNKSYKLTIFQFQDQYGFGWSKYRDLDFQVNRLSCEEIGYNFQVGLRSNF